MVFYYSSIIFLIMEFSEQITHIAKKHESGYKEQIMASCSAFCMKVCHQRPANYEEMIKALHVYCLDGKIDDDIDDFLKELGVDKKIWVKMQSGQERYECILQGLDRSVEDAKKKVIAQIDNYLSGVKKCASSQLLKEDRSKDNFEWLKLRNKYPMCEQKLKAKLVQAISDNKNQNRIRQRIQHPQTFDKVSLLDQSLVLDEYEKIKIDYKWSTEDQTIFISNINQLKSKFNKTQFLKRCGRFKFISDHELQTLASEEISRRLDQNNKVYLSRQFLLDKYYSTTDFLTEQEMRFILKTSPMLSKCVDKNFIRNAIKNIDYEDINKLELKIAENIISRFDQIRRAVRESRKHYKQSCNNQIKERIVQFQKRQQFQIIREMAREQLKKHKIRTNTLSKSTVNRKPMNLENKKKYFPLNLYHPSSGLFVKDCNEQCNDDLFNHYEMGYIASEKRQKDQQKFGLKSSMSLLQFYSGGMTTKTPPIPTEAINTICRLVKAQYYQKLLRETLQNYQIPSTPPTNRTQSSVLRGQPSCYDFDKRPKTIHKLSTQQSSQAMKRKILESKQKAKSVVYVNKLLSFAAQNSYAAFRGLNAKFTPDQVNSKDRRGNTALYYASKNQNLEFITHLLNLGADPSIPCEKQFTPFHFICKTNSLNLIVRCLTGSKSPNLNALNNQNKTALAYCTHDVLARLYLQQAVLTVQNRRVQFDNNSILTMEKLEKLVQSIGWDIRTQTKAKIL